jgi:hypothetical protein
MVVIKICIVSPVCVTSTLNYFSAKFVEALLKFGCVAVVNEDVVTFRH